MIAEGDSPRLVRRRDGRDPRRRHRLGREALRRYRFDETAPGLSSNVWTKVFLMIGPDRRVLVHNQRLIDMLDFPAALFDGPGRARRPDPLPDRHRRVPRLGTRSPVFWLKDGILDLSPRDRRAGAPRTAWCWRSRTVPLQTGAIVRTYTDITQRREQERAIRASEAKYRVSRRRAAADGLDDPAPHRPMLLRETKRFHRLLRRHRCGTARANLAKIIPTTRARSKRRGSRLWKTRSKFEVEGTAQAIGRCLSLAQK